MCRGRYRPRRCSKLVPRRAPNARVPCQRARSERHSVVRLGPAPRSHASSAHRDCPFHARPRLEIGGMPQRHGVRRRDGAKWQAILILGSVMICPSNELNAPIDASGLRESDCFLSVFVESPVECDGRQRSRLCDDAPWGIRQSPWTETRTGHPPVARQQVRLPEKVARQLLPGQPVGATAPRARWLDASFVVRRRAQASLSSQAGECRPASCASAAVR